MSDNGLLPCPFCGNANVKRTALSLNASGQGTFYSVHCPRDDGGCGAVSGSAVNNRDEGDRRWNRRANDGISFSAMISALED